jgi:hypothetical protein
MPADSRSDFDDSLMDFKYVPVAGNGGLSSDMVVTRFWVPNMLRLLARSFAANSTHTHAHVQGTSSQMLTCHQKSQRPYPQMSDHG